MVSFDASSLDEEYDKEEDEDIAMILLLHKNKCTRRIPPSL
jgi:hypothetical protein